MASSLPTLRDGTWQAISVGDKTQSPTASRGGTEGGTMDKKNRRMRREHYLICPLCLNVVDADGNDGRENIYAASLHSPTQRGFYRTVCAWMRRLVGRPDK
jgi:hypothetical protein